MNVVRFPENPIVTPADVPPSRPDFEVVCAFNAAVTQYNDEILMLMRVAERPIDAGDGLVRVPVLNCKGREPFIDVLAFNPNDPKINCCDPRKVITPDGMLLTTISHLRIARSKDGRHFTVDPTPALFPDRESEAYGLEDSRITKIGDTYYVAYKSVGAIGITVSLAETKDFVTFEKKGIIFAPENLDVCIFPEKVNGRYVTLHRPVSLNIAAPNMWVAYSDDLLNWGNHHFLMGVDPNNWDSGRVGGGAIPIKTERGWLAIYHGATPEDYYCLGAVLLDLNEPHKIIARGSDPLLVPEAPYEKEGFFPNVVFSCGAVVDGDRVLVYYGAADMVMAGVEMSLSEILDSLVPTEEAAATV